MSRPKAIWDRLRTLGTGNLAATDFQQKVSVGINQMALYVICIDSTIGLAVYFFMAHSLVLLIGVLVEIGLAFIPLLLNYRERHQAAGVALYVVLAAGTFFFCCLLGNLARVDLMIVVLMGSTGFFIAGRRNQFICYSVAVLVFIAVYVNGKVGYIHQLEVDNTIARHFLFWSAFSVVVFLVITVFNWYRKNNDLLREQTNNYAAQIAESLKMEELENRTKDKFIANATHEMKVSFRSIFAIISILQRDDPKELKTNIDDLRAACKYSNSILDNIFEYERYKAGRKPELLNQLIDVRMVIGGIVEIYRYLADEKNVAIWWNVTELVPRHMLCDEFKLRQIVTNLLHNAIKFTNNDTAVTIEVTQLGDRLILTIKDRGDGIGDELRERMFEPFVTRNPEGLGLGLFIVRELVAAFDGSIEVVNNKMGGATFTVSLQLQETPTERPTAMMAQ